MKIIDKEEDGTSDLSCFGICPGLYLLAAGSSQLYLFPRCSCRYQLEERNRVRLSIDGQFELFALQVIDKLAIFRKYHQIGLDYCCSKLDDVAGLIGLLLLSLSKAQATHGQTYDQCT